MRLLVLTALLLVPWAAIAERLPVEYYTRLPSIENVLLSPSGLHIAYFFNSDSRTDLIVRGTSDTRPVAIYSTDNRRTHFNWFRWANDERLLLSETRSRRVWLADNQRLRTTRIRQQAETDRRTKLTRLVGLNRDGSKRTALTNPHVKRSRKSWIASNADHVINLLPQDHNHVLLAADLDEFQFPTVYRMNIYNGSRQRVVAHRPPIRDWMTDRQGQVRIGSTLEQTKVIFETRDHDGAPWRVLWRYDLNTESGPIPIGFGDDPNILYVRAGHQGRDAVFAADLRIHPPRLTLLQASPTRDVGAVLIGHSNKIVGLYFAGAQDRYIFWDSKHTQLQRTIDGALPQFRNFIVSMSASGEQFIVASFNPQTPTRYLLGQRGSSTLSVLGSTYPELQYGAISGKRAIAYRASDGIQIGGFLTTPIGIEPRNLPMIVLPHGGPQTHDSGAFDYWAEFLADRGYAVMQPNFRGSTGYGQAFHRAGFKQWGLRMQDDISDGVTWLIEQGIADPERVCIVGSSYGGYAALMGALKTPELYRCAVSLAGVTDLKLLLREQGESAVNQLNQTRIGNPYTDHERLTQTSPLHLADQLQIPVLLLHGDRDNVVSIKHSKRFAGALHRAGKQHELVTIKGADHALRNHDQRTRVFKAIETFLTSHIGPGPLPRRD